MSERAGLLKEISVPGTTCERDYPTPFVLHNLDLGDMADDHNSRCLGLTPKRRIIYGDASKLRSTRASLLPGRKLRNANIVSIGEGYSGLTPYLRKLGASAIGVDLNDVYGAIRPGVQNAPMAGVAAEYIQRYQDYLAIGDATKLETLLAPNSQDLILSHAVFDKVKTLNDGASKFIKGALLSLKVDGEFRFNILADGPDGPYGPTIKRIKDYLSSVPTDSYELSIVRSTARWGNKRARDGLEGGSLFGSSSGRGISDDGRGPVVSQLSTEEGCYRSDTGVKVDLSHMSEAAEAWASRNIAVIIKKLKPLPEETKSTEQSFPPGILNQK